MTKLGFIRAGGLLMIISGLALGYSYISHPQHMPAEVIASSSWILIHALFAVSLVLGLLGTTALYAVTAQRAGRLGLTGYVMLFVGMMMIFGLDYYEVLIAPFMATNYPEVINDYGAGDTMGMVAFAFPVSGFLTVVGYALLGTAWKRCRIIPGYLGLFLILSAIAFGVGLSPAGDIEVARITAAVFGAALVAVGISAMLQNQNFNAAAGKHP
ncbi:MAG: hypothetical protein OER98_13970 [Gammaproteobacteria bacterium]|nr:hypothetical protein [Gammaproteobacteria bacterium]